MTIGGIDYYGSTSGGTPGAYYDDVCFGEGWVITGIEDVTVNNTMVYPNPANDLLRISYNNGTINHISLTNSVGQIVVDEVVNAPNVKIDISKLPKGVYFATIDTPSGTATQKVIVK